jgi:hypothetical protein
MKEDPEYKKIKRLTPDEHIRSILKLSSQEFKTIEYESGERVRIHKKKS